MGDFIQTFLSLFSSSIHTPHRWKSVHELLSCTLSIENGIEIAQGRSCGPFLLSWSGEECLFSADKPSLDPCPVFRLLHNSLYYSYTISDDRYIFTSLNASLKKSVMKCHRSETCVWISFYTKIKQRNIWKCYSWAGLIENVHWWLASCYLNGPLQY